MYNKLFTKILDSSIWLESDYTRIVWITLLATMDEDGFCQYAAPGNVAQRAIVPLEKAEAALKVLESPDKNSSDDENDGRRIERVPGGWMVLNCKKYKELATRETSKNQTRERVRRFRERNCNADVTLCNDQETKSETETETNTSPETGSGEGKSLFPLDDESTKPSKKKKDKSKVVDPRHTPFKKLTIRCYQYLNDVKDTPWGPRDAGQLAAVLKRYPALIESEFYCWLKNYTRSKGINRADPPYVFLPRIEKYRNEPLDKFGHPLEEKPEERAWR